MKKIILSISLLFMALATFAQALTLDECQAEARSNHPLLKQAGVIQQLYNLQLKNVTSGYLPQIDLSGKISYQSDAISISIPALGLDMSQNKDQYKAYIDIKQKIYDFGLTHNLKEAQKSDYELNLAQNDVDLYQIKATVNSLYFTLLALRENSYILDLKQKSLDESIKVLQSAVNNGVVLPNALDNLNAEKLTTQQQQMELQNDIKTSLDLLGIITGKTIDENVTLTKPLIANVTTNDNITRPELALFDSQKARLLQQESVLKSQRLPMLYAFGEAGYGRPGLNMLSNNFKDWYVAGIGLSWNLWDGNKTKHNRDILKTQAQSIDIAQENFERSIKMQLVKEQNNIAQLEQSLTIDEKVVKLKQNIAKRSESSMKNGTITSADYIRDLNASLMAMTTKKIHEIQLLQSQINCQNILGKQDHR